GGAALPPPDGPQPTHRWQERERVAARGLTTVRTVVAALADEHTLPAENLLPPDVVRRLAWQPPDPAGVAEVAADLAAHGGRPWQGGVAGPAVRRAPGPRGREGEKGGGGGAGDRRGPGGGGAGCGDPAEG